MHAIADFVPSFAMLPVGAYRALQAKRTVDTSEDGAPPMVTRIPAGEGKHAGASTGTIQTLENTEPCTADAKNTAEASTESGGLADATIEIEGSVGSGGTVVADIIVQELYAIADDSRVRTRDGVLAEILLERLVQQASM